MVVNVEAALLDTIAKQGAQAAHHLAAWDARERGDEQLTNGRLHRLQVLLSARDAPADVLPLSLEGLSEARVSCG